MVSFTTLACWSAVAAVYPLICKQDDLRYQEQVDFGVCNVLMRIFIPVMPTVCALRDGGPLNIQGMIDNHHCAFKSFWQWYDLSPLLVNVPNMLACAWCA